MSTIPKFNATLLALSVALAVGATAATAVAATPPKQPGASPEQVKAIETWTYTQAIQAATFAAPLVAMYNLR
jgi:hypothetical protein